jgi:hypothetical protein
MFSHQLYNIVHVVGIILLMSALGGIAIHAANGGTRASNRVLGLVAGLHGIGAFLIILGGFGMLARLGITGGLPGWIHAKLAIWLLLGAAMFLPYRRPATALPLMMLLPVAGGVATWLAIYKPF